MKNGGKNKSVAFIFLFSVVSYQSCLLSLHSRLKSRWESQVASLQLEASSLKHVISALCTN